MARASQGIYDDGLFEWDRRKAASNSQKHGIAFEEAALTFFDPNALEVDDLAHSSGEKRIKRLGQALGGKVLMVVYTLRGGEDGRQQKVRIISARVAHRKERAAYAR